MHVKSTLNLLDPALLRTAIFLLGFAGMAACADTAREADAPESGVRTDETAPAGETDEVADVATDEATGAGTLSSAEIEMVVSTVNQAEIDAGQLALQKASSAEVKQYAQKMVNEHEGLEQQTEGQTVETSADPNALSSQLKTQAHQTMQNLQAKSGAEFDRAYIDSQVQMHRQVLDTIENQLLPSAEDAEIRDVLETARTSVQQHLDEAEQIQGNLQA